MAIKQRTHAPNGVSSGSEPTGPATAPQARVAEVEGLVRDTGRQNGWAEELARSGGHLAGIPHTPPPEEPDPEEPARTAWDSRYSGHVPLERVVFHATEPTAEQLVILEKLREHVLSVLRSCGDSFTDQWLDKARETYGVERSRLHQEMLLRRYTVPIPVLPPSERVPQPGAVVHIGHGFGVKDAVPWSEDALVIRLADGARPGDKAPRLVCEVIHRFTRLTVPKHQPHGEILSSRNVGCWCHTYDSGKPRPSGRIPAPGDTVGFIDQFNGEIFIAKAEVTRVHSNVELTPLDVLVYDKPREEVHSYGLNGWAWVDQTTLPMPGGNGHDASKG